MRSRGESGGRRGDERWDSGEVAAGPLGGMAGRSARAPFGEVSGRGVLGLVFLVEGC